jgi:hypothetical protein
MVGEVMCMRDQVSELQLRPDNYNLREGSGSRWRIVFVYY